MKSDASGSKFSSRLFSLSLSGHSQICINCSLGHCYTYFILILFFFTSMIPEKSSIFLGSCVQVCQKRWRGEKGPGVSRSVGKGGSECTK